MMKLAKEQERTQKLPKEKKERKRGSGSLALDLGLEGLFEELRSLRTRIARQEKVPPYIVFSDKTLVHMCSVRPKSKEEMLTVTGVGEFKYEKYGEEFLRCVMDWKAAQ